MLFTKTQLCLRITAAVICLSMLSGILACGNASPNETTETSEIAAIQEADEVSSSQATSEVGSSQEISEVSSYHETAEVSSSEETAEDSTSEAAFETAPSGKAVLSALEASPEWVVRLGEERNAEQLFVVAAVGKTTAMCSLHEKDAEGTWRNIMTTPGIIGKNGLGKTKEGDAKTPVGTFHFTEAFGIADDPGCTAFDYIKVTDQHYWSGDYREGYKYNFMVTLDEFPDLDVDNSEHIIEYDPDYTYAMNISYNEEGIPYVGSAIFLHCFGVLKPYTGGCVGLPEEQMRVVLQNVRKDCVIVIDSLETIGPELWEQLGLTREIAGVADLYEETMAATAE